MGKFDYVVLSLVCCIGIAMAQAPIFETTQAQNRVQVYRIHRPYNGEYPVVWTQVGTRPFQELLLSWNARRPEQGCFSFDVSVLRNKQWSPWLSFARWGKLGCQKTFLDQHSDRFVFSRHSRVVLHRSCYGNGFRVRVSSRGGADMQLLHGMSVCLSNPEYFFQSKHEAHKPLRSVCIRDIVPQSQMALNHKRADSLCSPTATAMIVSCFRRRHGLPTFDAAKGTILFAECARDRGDLDIYGNWPLNVAQAYDAADGAMWCRVQRLEGLAHLHRYLCRNIPVAVSIRGPIAGGASEYKGGHFVVVAGWDARTKEVLCFDPAFVKPGDIMRRYYYKDFARAWQRSRRLAYVFESKK